MRRNERRVCFASAVVDSTVLPLESLSSPRAVFSDLASLLAPYVRALCGANECVLSNGDTGSEPVFVLRLDQQAQVMSTGDK